MSNPPRTPAAEADFWRTTFYPTRPAGAPPQNTPGAFAAPRFIRWDERHYPNHDKIHVAFLLPWMVMGGADLFNLNLLQGLDTSRFRASVLTTNPAQNTWRDRFLAATPDVLELPSFLEMDDIATFLACFIQSREIDLLFVSNSQPAYHCLPFLRQHFPQLAVVDYVHAPDWRVRGGGFARTSGMLGEVLDKTCTCNEDTRREIIEIFRRDPASIETVYIGVDADHFNPEITPEGQARQQLGIAPGRPIVLFPCRTAPQKRPMLMMHIARHMASAGSPAAFVVVGDGPTLPQMQAFAAQNKLQQTVFFAGRQQDLRPFYRDAALTLICSSFEGLALTAYESMAMSTPVVTSDVGGQAELVTPETGVLLPLLAGKTQGDDAGFFTEDEVPLYADVLGRLLAEPATLAALAAHCRPRVQSAFTLGGMVARMQAIFTALCGDDARCHRAQQAEKLAAFPHLWQELSTLSAEADKAATLLEQQEDSARRQAEKLAAAQGELARIRAMRSWRLAEKFSNNPLAQALHRLRNPR